MIASSTKKLAEFVDRTAEQHHSDKSRLSHSQLEDFRKDPALYHGRHVLRTIPFERTNEMDFGTACHHSLLIGGEAFVEIPRNVLNSDGHKKGKAWTNFQAENAGKILLKADEAAELRRMIAAVYDHDKARALLSGEGRNEVSINWTDEENGTPLRSRLDRLTDLCVIDYKTCSTVSRLALPKICYDAGYFRQLAFYLKAARQVTGRADIGCVLICQSKEPPYSVRVVSPDAKTMRQAMDENRRDLDNFARCDQTGDWREVGYGLIEEISSPKYTFQF